MTSITLSYFERLFKTKLLIDIFQQYQNYNNELACIEHKLTLEQAQKLSKLTHFVAEKSTLELKGESPEFFLNTRKKDNERANRIIELRKIYTGLIDIAVENDLDRKKIVAWVQKRHNAEQKAEIFITHCNLLNWCDAVMAYYMNEITSFELDQYLFEYNPLGKTKKMVTIKLVVEMADKILREYAEINN